MPQGCSGWKNLQTATRQMDQHADAVLSCLAFDKLSVVVICRLCEVWSVFKRGVRAKAEDIRVMDDLLQKIIEAAHSQNAEQAVRSVLQAFVTDPEQAAANTPDFEENDVILFEDETVSIWFCRFAPGQSVPPHNHLMSATIGVFRGIERNDVFTRTEQGRLERSEQIDVSPGDVISLAADVIHGVTCISDTASEAIHVYLGALSKIDRSLFDINNDEELAFTDDAYKQLTASLC